MGDDIYMTIRQRALVGGGPAQPREVRVWVKPGSRKGPLVEEVDPKAGRNVDLVVFIQQRAVDGRANDELVGVLGDHFGVAARDVEIVSGWGSRVKRIRLPGDVAT